MSNYDDLSDQDIQNKIEALEREAKELKAAMIQRKWWRNVLDKDRNCRLKFFWIDSERGPVLHVILEDRHVVARYNISQGKEQRFLEKIKDFLEEAGE